MPTLTATYLDDVSRIRLAAADLAPNVVYRMEKAIGDGDTWETVRGGKNISSNTITKVDDFEFTPNEINKYRLIGPELYDSFLRESDPTGTNWGTTDTGHSWSTIQTAPGAHAWVSNGVGVTSNAGVEPHNYLLQIVDVGLSDMEVTYSVSVPGVSDAPMEFNILMRTDPFLINGYAGQIIFNPDGTVRLELAKRTGSDYQLLQSVDNVGSWVPGRRWFVRFRLAGSALSGRAWSEFDEENTNQWDLFVINTEVTSGTHFLVRPRNESATPGQRQFWGPIAIYSVPNAVVATAQVTPVVSGVWLKSVAFPSLNMNLGCLRSGTRTRDSRAAFFDIISRHPILAVTDVGSTATWDISFVTESDAENKAVKALITYGSVLFLQVPGLADDCGPFDATPGGYVVPSRSAQAHPLPGKKAWQWAITLTKVARPDLNEVTPAMMTWRMLWNIIGPDGTWFDVWDLWPTWQDMWLNDTVNTQDPGGF